MPRRTIKTIIAAVSILAAMSPTARAHDSLAPRGAPHQWLPVEEWVFRHWVPFDERVLTRALGLRSHELEAYLYNDHHTLADLARRRGIDLNKLVTELLAPWGESVMERQKAVLRDHALRLLTQGHLAQPKRSGCSVASSRHCRVGCAVRGRRRTAVIHSARRPSSTACTPPSGR